MLMKFGRSIDRAVDMAFGGQMHDRIGIEACKQVSDCGAIADIRAD